MAQLELSLDVLDDAVASFTDDDGENPLTIERRWWEDLGRPVSVTIEPLR